LAVVTGGVVAKFQKRAMFHDDGALHRQERDRAARVDSEDSGAIDGVVVDSELRLVR
jgi:hypothetical protein